MSFIRTTLFAALIAAAAFGTGCRRDDSKKMNEETPATKTQEGTGAPGTGGSYDTGGPGTSEETKPRGTGTMGEPQGT